MGNLKDEALNTGNEDIKSHKLLEAEANLLRAFNIVLQYDTRGSQLMSAFLQYVSTTRLGYKDGTNLQFEFDFNKDDNLLTVKLLPDSPASAA